MDTHPITDNRICLLCATVLLTLLTAVHSLLLVCYAHTGWQTAAVDAVATTACSATLAYLTWFMAGLLAMPATRCMTVAATTVLWLGGSMALSLMLSDMLGLPDAPQLTTLPFKLLFGLPAWTALLLWYRLLKLTSTQAPVAVPLSPATAPDPQSATPPAEYLDRISVKDGTRIHLISPDELLYIQACGDSATLVTPRGEYVMEQTMKYFEAHLPPESFVHIHRSTIVSVSQISRLEQFGKETYQVLLKNGTRLRVSLSGYRLLRQRLGI